MHLWGHVKRISSTEAVVLPTSKIILGTSRGKLPTQLSVLEEDRQEWITEELQWGAQEGIPMRRNWFFLGLEKNEDPNQTWITALKYRNQETKREQQKRELLVTVSTATEYKRPELLHHIPLQAKTK